MTIFSFMLSIPACKTRAYKSRVITRIGSSIWKEKVASGYIYYTVSNDGVWVDHLTLEEALGVTV